MSMVNTKDNDNKEVSENERILKSVLSEHIGTDAEDIENDNSLKDDLGLNPVSMTEIIEGLKQKGIDVEKIDFDEAQTVGELIDLLDLEGEIK